MARLTEIEDETGDKTSASQSLNNLHKPEILTQAQREQALFESGVLEKLALPRDFVTLEEVQAQLATQGAGTASTSAASREKKNSRTAAEHLRSVNGQVDFAEIPDPDSDDDCYRNMSDVDYDAADDTAETLMREQEVNEMDPRLESSLDLLIWTMPFGFLYTLLDVLVRQQYGETVGMLDEGIRLSRSIPVLALFIHYNLTSQRKVFLQAVLFTISIGCGCSLIHIVNKSSYDVVLQRVAPLGTLWIFAIVRLDLLPACVGLAIVAAFVKKNNMKIVFD